MTLISDFDSLQFRNTLGRYLTGVTIVTAVMPDGSPTGVTINSFTSVSLDPALVLVCIDNNLGAYEAYAEGKRCAVHILSERASELSNRFASKGIDKFAEVTWHEGPDGVPILPGYIALIEGKIIHAYPGGDHTICVVQVEHIDAPDDHAAPLAFFKGKYVKLDSESS